MKISIIMLYLKEERTSLDSQDELSLLYKIVDTLMECELHCERYYQDA